jgi:hypothetical protein
MKKSSWAFSRNLDIGAGTELRRSAQCAPISGTRASPPDRLKFYNEDHILWVAPTCAVLPSNTRKAFHGGVSRVQVKVLDGKRKLGKARVNLDWGMNGSVTMFVTDLDDRFQNGMPRPYPVNVFANPIFAFDATAPNPLPPGTMTADFSGGGTANPVGCPSRFDDCAQIIFPAPGRFIVVLTLFFEDNSALCDNITVRVAECSGDGRLDIIPRPKRSVYDPANPNQANVDLTVRLTNTSKPKGGLPACGFLLRGADVLSCSSELKLGSVTDVKGTQFDLRHCSQTTSQPCDTDAECRPPVCAECQPGEVCLRQPHCSKTFDVPCRNDLDCAKQSVTCPNCAENEMCIRVLEVGNGSDISLGPGQSIDLFTRRSR